jgi:hypothetical protein
VKRFLIGLLLGLAAGSSGVVALLLRSETVRSVAKRETEFQIKKFVDVAFYGSDDKVEDEDEGPTFGVRQRYNQYAAPRYGNVRRQR